MAIDITALEQQSADFIRKDRATRYLPAALLNLADSLEGVGDTQGGRERLWESLQEYAKLGSGNGVARCYMALGEQARRLGNLEAALELFEQAIAACPLSAQREVTPIVALLADIKEAIALRVSNSSD
jgi:tetratricopeptide (TPR) repeat protein